MVNIGLILVCSIFSSILYRAGGLSQEQHYWIPKWMRHSWVRDWICPLFILLPLFLQHPGWQYIIAYAAIGGALTTYWDKLFGFDNYWFSGFVVGLACLPLIFCGVAWWIILVKAFLLAIAWGGWSAILGNDHSEEHTRGFLVGLLSI